MYGDGDPNVPLFEDFAGEDSSEDPEHDDKLARASAYLTAKAAAEAGVAVAVPVRVPVPYKRGPPKQTGLYAGPSGFLGQHRDPGTNTLLRVMSGAQRNLPADSGKSSSLLATSKGRLGPRRPPPKRPVPPAEKLPKATAGSFSVSQITGSNNVIVCGQEAGAAGYDRSLYPANPSPKKVPKKLKVKAPGASKADALKRRATLSFTKTVLGRMDAPSLARVLSDMQQNPSKNSAGGPQGPQKPFALEILYEASSPTPIPLLVPFTHTHSTHLHPSPLTHRTKGPSSRCRRITRLSRRRSPCWNVWTTT